MTFDKTKLKEKSTAIDIKTEKTLGQINLDFLFDYKIFPSKHFDIHDSMGTREKKNENR